MISEVGLCEPQTISISSYYNVVCLAFISVKNSKKSYFIQVRFFNQMNFNKEAMYLEVLSQN